MDKYIVLDDDDFDMHVMVPLVHCKDFSGLNEDRMHEALKLMFE